MVAEVSGYRVKNWKDFQHYKQRDPPWIKLHFRLLSSRDWVLLDDASRVLAIACMLIASRKQGFIPDDPEYIKRVAYLRRVDFKPLIKCGFLESLADASNLQANPLSEKEKESESDEAFHEKPEKTKRTFRAPKDFSPDLEFASLLCPDMDAETEAAKFLDYEFKTPRSDWLATWRNWVRKARDRGDYTKKGTGGIQWQ